jgi:hypothetical protein
MRLAGLHHASPDLGGNPTPLMMVPIERGPASQTTQRNDTARLHWGPILRALRLAALAWVTSSGVAAACTLCDSSTAIGVRRQVFGPDFLSNAAAVMAPVPILLAAVLLIANASAMKPKG